MRVLVWVLFLAMALCGCATVFHATDGSTFPPANREEATVDARQDAVRASAAHDLKCDAASIRVGNVVAYSSESLGYADGCGKRATYAFSCTLHVGECDCPLILTSLFALP